MTQPTPLDPTDAPQPVTGVRREPAMVAAAVTAVVAVLTLVGINVTDATRDQITGLVTALVILAPLVQGWVTRRHVTPTAAVAAATDPAGVVRSGPADHAAPNGSPVVVAPADGSSPAGSAYTITANGDAAEIAAAIQREQQARQSGAI